MNMKRHPLVLTVIVLAGFTATPVHADSSIITRTTFENVSVNECAGTEVAIEYQNCGPALLPVTDGVSSAEHQADATGVYSLNDHAQGGNTAESRLATTFISIGTTYVIEVPMKRVDITEVFTVGGGILSSANQGSAIFGGGALIYSLAVAGSRGLTDTDCDDGTAIEATGQTGGSLFKVDTPPGTYTLHVHYTCGGGGNIKPGQSFGADIQARGYTLSRQSNDSGSAAFAGSLDHVTFSFATP